MLSQPSVVDLVTKDEDVGTYELVLVVERGEWLLPDCHALLQEKLNTYLNYVVDGQMQEDYPDASADRVEVLIQSELPPPPSTAALVQKIINMMKIHGVAARYLPL